MPSFAHQIKMVTVYNFAQQPFLVNLNRAKNIVLYFKTSPNLVAIEIRAIHVVWVNLDAILVHEELGQHRLLASYADGRCRRCSTRFYKHTFFKALSLVFTCGIATVLYYNSPKCHND